MNPMFKYTGLYFLELKTRVWMEGEPVPVFPRDPEVANEEAFCCARQVENSDYFVDF
jgi:hypothetical protein